MFQFFFHVMFNQKEHETASFTFLLIIFKKQKNRFINII